MGLYTLVRPSAIVFKSVDIHFHVLNATGGRIFMMILPTQTMKTCVSGK